MVDGFGCEIGMGQWITKLAWVSELRNQRGSGGCKIGVDRRGWCGPWVWVVLGLLLFLFLVVVGLMSVGVVGFVIDDGGGGD